MRRLRADRGPTREHLDWPFFGPEHRDYAERLDRFAASGALADVDHHDVDASCRKPRAPRLAQAGLLDACVAAPTATPRRSIRAKPALRAKRSPFTTGSPISPSRCRGLAPGAIAIAGSPELRARVLAEGALGRMARGLRPFRERGGLRCGFHGLFRANVAGDEFVLNGEKTWISNGGIADVYCVFARTGEAPGARGLSAFVVLPGDPGFSIAERIEVIAPHPLATLRFENCRVPVDRMLGAPGEGFKIAMRTLDIFRASVAAAALGFAAPRARRGPRPRA